MQWAMNPFVFAHDQCADRTRRLRLAVRDEQSYSTNGGVSKVCNRLGSHWSAQDSRRHHMALPVYLPARHLDDKLAMPLKTRNRLVPSQRRTLQWPRHD